jgi:hypothetical protein
MPCLRPDISVYASRWCDVRGGFRRLCPHVRRRRPPAAASVPALPTPVPWAARRLDRVLVPLRPEPSVGTAAPLSLEAPRSFARRPPPSPVRALTGTGVAVEWPPWQPFSSAVVGASTTRRTLRPERLSKPSTHHPLFTDCSCLLKVIQRYGAFVFASNAVSTAWWTDRAADHWATGRARLRKCPNR